VNQLPAHTHSANPIKLTATPKVGDTVTPTGNAVALNFARLYSSTSPTVEMHANSIIGDTGSTGGGQQHDNRQPYLTVNCSIALVGIFPSRN